MKQSLTARLLHIDRREGKFVRLLCVPAVALKDWTVGRGEEAVRSKHVYLRMS